MKIGVIGGSFDPIHSGHTYIIKQAIKSLDLDCMYIIPTGNNPWKDETYATDKDRLAMLDIALKDVPKTKVLTIEIEEKKKKNYTIDTIEKLIEAHDSMTQFYYIVGMDQAILFDKWKSAKKISKLVQLVAFNRTGYKINDVLDKFHFMHLDIDACNHSSTKIREGKIDYLDPNVLAYITKEGLYLESMLKETMSKKRFKHTVSMANLASKIALENGLDSKKAYIAGMFHDIAKEMDKDKSKEIMEQYFPSYLDKPDQTWHQWVSSYVARTTYLVEDKEVLTAIENHTLGCIGMTPLAMCIYVADKYDPTRDFDSSKEIELCKKDVKAGFVQCLQDFYVFSKKKKRPIDDSFFELYEYYVTKGE